MVLLILRRLFQRVETRCYKIFQGCAPGEIASVKPDELWKRFGNTIY